MSDTPLPKLPPRAPDSHKGDYGRALIIGGSWGMAGAVSLAGMAALRGGAGLVKLAVPEICLSTVASYEPCYMTIPLPADTKGRISLAARDVLAEAAEAATAVACGPGLGQSAELTQLVSWLYRHVERPMVVDADALNALAQRQEILARPGGPRIFTPHPGEFARLTERDRVDDVQRESAAREFAAHTGGVVVLKGHKTVVSDGRQVFVNSTGNPGMATGGVGDVLTGLITALVCQGLSPYDAARLGVHAHGLAGDLAAAAKGQVGLIAGDVVNYLPQAMR